MFLSYYVVYKSKGGKLLALGNKDIMASNIKYYMSKYDIDRNKLCADLDLKYMTVSDWINAKSYPRIDKIEMLANYFGVKKSDLVEQKADHNNNLPSKGVQIPVLGDVAAGIPIEAIEDIIDYEEIDEDLASKGEFFGLRIKGNSMSPRIQSGDVVIVRVQSDAESGDIVIAKVNGDDACCKRLQKHDEGINLISLNPEYEPMFFSKKDIADIPVHIIGKVVELRGKF